MAKRETTDSEPGDERVTRRSTRLKTTNEEPVDEKLVKASKAAVKTKAMVKKSLVKEEEIEGGKEVKTIITPLEKTNGTTTALAREKQYWLLKAEPESRLEKGHDVKFSIDDLAAKTEPEPWDGIRSYAARNNLRAMKRGDLAFFYHSSCKTPAIVGVMEVVQEHSPDLTAQDPKAAYYDPKDTDPSNPRWSLVHVSFREKFTNPLTLHGLKAMQSTSAEISNMQLLKQSRLSVTGVTKGEWEFLMSVIKKPEEMEGEAKGEMQFGCMLYR
ncbi:hypothetical protein VC83_04695 [Pseudogymnoascus destructans]|uniref:Thymocyte nuclear protein 1 n=2 Tax=Pseudogymnoascus destructans TaxID=655981 RepID=L8FTF7_PSED2|nr:uncharacterized protein VC83_04695 [Pseudogymnoascus destructans]ELR03849.1 hypothetical protein GMDG_01378 [Pseudogymnoascus destructans 20631-21]OAF57356.1 hypothetical protein VC83_04695 [Pseudogymnoascus destructans]